jgi:hypothetical protein
VCGDGRGKDLDRVANGGGPRSRPEANLPVQLNRARLQRVHTRMQTGMSLHLQANLLSGQEQRIERTRHVTANDQDHVTDINHVSSGRCAPGTERCLAAATRVVPPPRQTASGPSTPNRNVAGMPRGRSTIAVADPPEIAGFT